MIKRTLAPAIQEFIDDKIILLSGPRQVGKTSLSKSMARQLQYFNFDYPDHRQAILERSWMRNGQIVVFDEIQKLKKWKQWIKGIYDIEKGQNKFLLTGSSRMDAFKKVGDSLAGRHVLFRLHPFSVKEFGVKNPQALVLDMLRLGSFPEPLLAGSDRKAAIWRRSHLDMIIRQDLIQLENVRDLVSIELLIDALRRRVGHQIVFKNIAQELSVSPHTVKKWIQILESLFVIFIVYPYTKNVLDAVKKEPKVYFYDIGQVESGEGAKLENLVALHLLKRNQFLEDTEGRKLRLAYLRDKKKREIDFVVEENNQLTHLVEVKKTEDHFNPQLDYFAQRLRPQQEAIQLVLDLKREKDYDSHQILGLARYLSRLET